MSFFPNQSFFQGNQNQNNYSANAFSGGHQPGGFDPSRDSPPNSPARGGGDKPGGIFQTMMPVTIRQLINAVQVGADNYKINNRELSQVTIVGRVVKTVEQATSFNLEINDGTGTFDVRIWYDTDDKYDYNQIQKSNWKEGVYVRVTGHLRGALLDKQSLVAYSIELIEDYNEYTYHLLESIFVSLYHTKDGHLSSTATTSTSYASGSSSNTSYVPQGQQGDLFSSTQQSILQILSGCTSKAGYSVDQIKQKLPPNIGDNELRSAMEFLQQEGHIYEGYDENHFLAMKKI
eukprot:TRINITY_DN148_c0_g2_i1.p1 TRINITY_DN148_c0_g2~~TRINITY_DN148_c0_g2_i1.p1  ORF type:complete len:290 (-),score=46.37 TRINITY_DN148_c0_g2_i1:35-904(-)